MSLRLKFATKTRFQVACLQVKLDFGTLSPSLGRLGAPKLERPPHLACLSEATCLLSSTGHLSLFGYALTIRPAIQGGVFKIIKEFFLRLEKFFWKNSKKKKSKIQEIKFFFLKIFIFPGKNLGFSEKKIGKFGFFRKKKLENLGFSEIFFGKFGLFSARGSSVFELLFLAISEFRGAQRCPMFHARPIETLSNVPRASNRTSQRGERPTLTVSLIAPSIFKASCDGR